MKVFFALLLGAGLFLLAGCQIGNDKVDVVTRGIDAVQFSRQAQVYIEHGEYAQADELLAKAQASDYHNAGVHYWSGRSKEGQGQLTKAIYEYRLAVKFDPSLEIAQIALANALHVGGEEEASCEAVRTYLTYPNLPLRDYMALANNFFSMGLDNQALITLETATKMEPHRAQAFVAMADYFEKKGDREQYIDWLIKAGKAEPTYPGLSKRLGKEGLRLQLPREIPPAPASQATANPTESKIRDLGL